MIWLLACTDPASEEPRESPPMESGAHSSPDSRPDSSPDSTPESTPDTGDARSLHQVVLKATHNSYELGPVADQLDAGVRGLELDVHQDGDDLRIGHLWPGDGVDGDDALATWLDAITAWSAAHPDHAPIVLTLDLKDAVDLGQLNALLPDPVDSLRVPDLRGHVVPVLSGDAGSRTNYLGDRGQDPAFATNGTTWIEVHSDGAGGIWTWVGDADGWHAHERIASGWDPAVALTDDGRVLVVHQAAAGSALYAKAGTLDGHTVAWQDGHAYDSGVAPSVEWLGGDAFREVHTSEWDASQNWSWQVTWPDTFEANEKTDDDLDETAGRVAALDGVLTLDGAPIRWAQKAHVESQRGSDLDTVFAAAASGSDVSDWVGDERVVRIWSWVDGDASVQLPATDDVEDPAWLEATEDALE